MSDRIDTHEPILHTLKRIVHSNNIEHITKIPSLDKNGKEVMYFKNNNTQMKPGLTTMIRYAILLFHEPKNKNAPVEQLLEQQVVNILWIANGYLTYDEIESCFSALYPEFL